MRNVGIVQMATPVKILILLSVMLLVCKGSCQCDLRDLEIAQSKTGAIVNHKPEWKVTITKNCPCRVMQLNLICPGFKTVKHIDPAFLQIRRNWCLVNGGYGFDPSFNFTYAWDHSYPFKIKPGFIVKCS